MFRIAVASVFAFSLLMLSVLLGCKNGIAPPDTPKPGMRDYVWKVDTLTYPGSSQVLMYDIWGSSARDVYVVGHNDRYVGQMYHFNGASWIPVDLTHLQGGSTPGGLELTEVYGFNRNDVWAIGFRLRTNPSPPPAYSESAAVIHFDGSTWANVPINHGFAIAGIWGSASNDVWLSATDGSIFHYDGIQISRMLYDSTIVIHAMAGVSGSAIFANGSRKSDKTTPTDTLEYVSVRYDGVRWALVDSFLQYPGYPGDRFGYYGIWGSSDGQVFSVSKNVFKWDGSSWQSVRATHDPMLGISGTSSLNIFAVGNNNSIDHYNGTDWHRYTQFLDSQKYAISVWCNSEEVFVVSNGNGRSFIAHGM